MEIVGVPILIGGPFRAGGNGLDWMEQEYFNGTSTTLADIAVRSPRTAADTETLKIFRAYGDAWDVYNNAYYSGSAIANATGLLGTMYMLEERLAANDTAVVAMALMDPILEDYPTLYFGSGSAFVNGTSG